MNVNASSAKRRGGAIGGDAGASGRRPSRVFDGEAGADAAVACASPAVPAAVERGGGVRRRAAPAAPAHRLGGVASATPELDAAAGRRPDPPARARRRKCSGEWLARRGGSGRSSRPRDRDVRIGKRQRRALRPNVRRDARPSVPPARGMSRPAHPSRRRRRSRGAPSPAGRPRAPRRRLRRSAAVPEGLGFASRRRAPPSALGAARLGAVDAAGAALRQPAAAALSAPAASPAIIRRYAACTEACFGERATQTLRKPRARRSSRTDVQPRRRPSGERRSLARPRFSDRHQRARRACAAVGHPATGSAPPPPPHRRAQSATGRVRQPGRHRERLGT